MEPKKKRGRKPKNKMIINENPQFDQENKIDNLIASLQVNKPKTNLETEVDVIGGVNDNSDDKFSFIDETPTSKICWNCCYDIELMSSFPIKYMDGVFYTCGNFCSYECAARYIFDTYNYKSLWEKYTLLNLLYNKNHNTSVKVKIAPSRLRLKKFGGDLTYEEYINKSSRDMVPDIYIPPYMMHVTHEVSNVESVKLTDSGSLKMSRKSEMVKDNIHQKLKDNSNEEVN